jgi:uracil-DNA glycosylase family 4
MSKRPQSPPAEQRPLGRPVLPAGSNKSGILFVGEAPGVAEEMKGQPFVGKTGREISRYCKQAGIHYPDTRRCNVVLHRPYTRSATAGNTAPAAWEIKRDEHVLIEEIRKSRPRWIAAVGRTAAVWLLGAVDVEDTEGFAFPLSEKAKARLRGMGTGVRTSVESSTRPVRGVSVSRTEGWLRTLRVVVLRHPAAGLHQPDQQPFIYWDFMRLGQYVAGKLDPNPPVDEYPDPDYYEPRGVVVLVSRSPLAIDTEGLRGRVWGLSYCQTPGSAGVVRVTNKQALRSIKEQLYGR